MKYVRIINRSGEHLLALINDILDMAKIESGRMTLNRAPFTPYGLLKDLQSLFNTLAEAKSLSLTIEHDDELRVTTLLGDEGKLRQVLVNLVGNGLKFTHKGGVNIRLRTETASGGASEDDRALLLSVEVEDSGVGISPEQIELIFAPFQQSDSGKKAGGTGLGLTISRKFVEMMGGTLTCESELGKGSCFRFRIPVERVQDVSPRPSQPGKRVLGLQPGSGRPLILVADDDDTSRGLVTELLAEAGFDCAEAANGLQAVESCSSRAPDAVLMDMNMPVLDGYEATRMIKGGGRRGVPVIALTADAFARDAVAACGADEYLRKPFVADELFAALRKVLGVEYVYEDVSRGEAAGGERGTENGGPGSLKTIDLSMIPENLLRDLHGAVEDGDVYLIRELIRSISTVDEKAGEELLLLAERYDYERLLEIANNEGGLSDGE
jgi:CheY-like chemotaxis protein